MKHIFRIVALAPVLGLVACGGSSTEVTSIVVNTATTPFIPGDTGGTAGSFIDLPFATTANQTVSVAALTNVDFSTKTAAASWIDANGTITRNSSNNAVDFKIVNANTIELSDGSNTWTFRNQGGSPVEVWVADSRTGDGPSFLSGVFGQGSNIPNNLKSIFFGSISVPPQQSGTNTFSSDIYAIGGFETDPAEVTALSAAANYTGPAQIVARVGASDSAAGDVLGGTFNINVDFAGSNAVTGSISGAADAEFGGGTVELGLAPTSIAGGANDFTTTFSRTGGTNTSITGFSNTNLAGTLYGVDGAEMGILMDGDVTVSGTTLPTAGFGLGLKQ